MYENGYGSKYDLGQARMFVIKGMEKVRKVIGENRRWKLDINNYVDVYQNDLLMVEKEIIISSPAISGKKVYEMIHLLRGKQEAGIKIIIVTWKPDCYGYGDSVYWQELQEQIRRLQMNCLK